MRKGEGITGLTFLRTIVWDGEVKAFRSPSRKHFMWDRSRIAISHCRYSDEHEGCNALDKSDYPLIKEPCTCGFYGSHDLSIVDKFSRDPGSVWILVEALGDNTWAYTNCVRAPAVVIQAVVNHNSNLGRTLSTNKQGITKLTSAVAPLLYAQQYFNVPIIPLEQAKNICKATWTHKDIGNMAWNYERFF